MLVKVKAAMDAVNRADVLVAKDFVADLTKPIDVVKEKFVETDDGKEVLTALSAVSTLLEVRLLDLSVVCAATTGTLLVGPRWNPSRVPRGENIAPTTSMRLPSRMHSIYPFFRQSLRSEVLSFQWKTSGKHCQYVRYACPNEAKKSRWWKTQFLTRVYRASNC